MAELSHPRNLVGRKIIEACTRDDLPLLKDALAEYSASDMEIPKSDVLAFALRRAVRRNSIEVIYYLFEQGADTSLVQDVDLIVWGWSYPVAETLIEHGWDINKRQRDGSPSLLWSVLYDYNRVQWCLEHGATVQPPHQQVLVSADEPSLVVYHRCFACNPLLEQAAGSATVQTFELLRQHGALPGWRTLHEAIYHARKDMPVNPSNNEPHEDDGWSDLGKVINEAGTWEHRMGMVRHLVDTLGYDVNASDQPAPDARLPNHWGTPLCYVSMQGDCRELTWYLLDRGADPLKRAHPDAWNAIEYGERRATPVLRAIREWQARRDSSVGAGTT